jgi:hypothetical protein
LLILNKDVILFKRFILGVVWGKKQEQVMKKNILLGLILMALATGSIRAGQADLNLNLIDWSNQPFSDEASHYTATHLKDRGLSAYRFKSASALGEFTAFNGGKRFLFDTKVEVLPENGQPLFDEKIKSVVRYYPRWIFENASDKNLSADSALLMPSEDVFVMVITFKNESKSVINFRPRLVLEGADQGVDYTGRFLAKDQVFTLNSDFSAVAGSSYREEMAVKAGESKLQIFFEGDGALDDKINPDTNKLVTSRFKLVMQITQPVSLSAGQSLRFPVLFSFSNQPGQAVSKVDSNWTKWALPRGNAYQRAKTRWDLTVSRLPVPANRADLLTSRRAALTLLLSEYAPRGEMLTPMFSLAKSGFDAFFAAEMPIIALGWTELDNGKAQQALEQMTAFASAAPAPVPPYTGEKLLLWEVSGFGLHAFAGWELYRRDDNVARAGVFFSSLSKKLRNESAWWPLNRDGDGNFLYAFSRPEEQPLYQRWLEKAALGADPEQYLEAPLYKDIKLQTYSVALTSLMGWLFQMAALAADAADQSDETDKHLENFKNIQTALLQRCWRQEQGVYEQGLDGFFPFLLGVDTDPARARLAIENHLLPLIENEVLPFTEQGVFIPWRAYLMTRVLGLFGYRAEAAKASRKILDFFSDKKSFHSLYSVSGQALGAPGDAATAASVLALALDRHEQSAYILADTASVGGRLLEVRTPEGSLFITRDDLSSRKEIYPELSVSSARGGSILEEGAFIITSAEKGKIVINSLFSLKISEMASKRILFEKARKPGFIMEKGRRYLVEMDMISK